MEASCSAFIFRHERVKISEGTSTESYVIRPTCAQKLFDRANRFENGKNKDALFCRLSEEVLQAG